MNKKDRLRIKTFFLEIGIIFFIIGLSSLIVFSSIIPESIIGDVILLKNYEFFNFKSLIYILISTIILYGGYKIIRNI